METTVTRTHWLVSTARSLELEHADTFEARSGEKLADVWSRAVVLRLRAALRRRAEGA